MRSHGKGVTWEELFFDLALVFALTQFSRLLHEDHTWAGVGRTLILFVPVYWAWGGVTLYTDQRGINSLLDRVGVLTFGLGSLLMALTIPRAYDDHGLLFVAIYLVGRVLLAGLALRGLPSWRPLFVGPYGVFLLTGPLLLAGALVQGSARIVLWAVAATVDLLSPWVARHLVTQSRVQPAHFTHRYGLLIILVFGESIIQVGAVAVDESLTLVRLTALAAAYALVSVLWYAYFGYGLSDFRSALEEAPDQPDLRRTVLVYGHLLFSFAIITIAVGLAEMLPAPLHVLPPREAMLLSGGCALFLLTFAYAYWRIHHRLAWRRVGAGAACLLLVPLATLMPALIAVACLILVVVVMTAAEELAMRRQGGDAARGTFGPTGPTDRGPATEPDS
ncbi:low temperature requirement protein A [Micromonospora acroterricola]|uniref:Low temperature requirement protein A n=1 Tax=Micromonospora acroterricola TaxID=2202421 RepID=A0A317DD52_9ACTN|nr:low temperature requirement protein A [Micromonospora acroterricola]PWR12587.1 low temperature requirement protein A [Micromonospora acroterricola]